MTGFSRFISRSLLLPPPIDLIGPKDVLNGATMLATEEQAVLNPGEAFAVAFPSGSVEAPPWTYTRFNHIKI